MITNMSFSSDESSDNDVSETEETPKQEKESPVEQEKRFHEQIYNNESELRSLRKELRLLVKRNPQVKLFQTSELEDKINSLTKEQIIDEIEHFKEEVGLTEPFVGGSLLVQIAGVIVEKLFGYEGFAAHLSKNTTLIAKADSFVPTKMLEYSSSLRALQEFSSEIVMFHQKNGRV